MHKQPNQTTHIKGQHLKTFARKQIQELQNALKKGRVVETANGWAGLRLKTSDFTRFYITFDCPMKKFRVSMDGHTSGNIYLKFEETVAYLGHT